MVGGIWLAMMCRLLSITAPASGASSLGAMPTLLPSLPVLSAATSLPVIPVAPASPAIYRFPPEHIVDVMRQHRLMDAPGDGWPAPGSRWVEREGSDWQRSADRPQEAASKDQELGVRGAGGTTPDCEPLSVVGSP